MHSRAAAACAVAFTLLAGCGESLPELAPSRLPEPDAREVDSVIYLFGDAGYADEARDPVLRRLKLDIELWSGRVARDSGVVVLFLGDIIYPRGLHDAGDPTFERDSAIVQSQVNLLAGPNARRHGSIGYFLAGNHDWGHARDAAGVERLRNLEQFLDRRRAEGVHVRLQPEAGEPGPAVIDIRQHARLLLFDTAWWLLARNDYLKRRSFQQTEDAIRSTRDRFIIVGAHHPFQTASRHGGLIPFWKTLGVRFLLTRSGAALQDLTSPAYRELTNSMLEAFRAGPPLLFAGGHDHNLQLIDHQEDFPWPRFTAVSGSGSKVSDVGHIRGMLYRNAAPGYMRVVTHRSGRVDLFIIAAEDDDWLACSGTGPELEQCMEEGLNQFVTRYGLRIR
jgi:hypothetical protein